MAILADRGVLYRWRGAIGIALWMLGYALVRPWLHPWLLAKTSHIWYFEGGVVISLLTLLIFRIRWKLPRGEAKP